MQQLIILSSVVILLGCNSSNNSNNDLSDPTPVAELQSPIETAFNYEDFPILKGALGSIRIGMAITEAEKQFKGLTKKTDEAVWFGFGGGSPAYLYYLDEELVFGLIPRLNTDSLLIIIAVSEKLKATNGLNPGSTVSEMVHTYPGLTFERDLMNGWEVFEDRSNRWDFVFCTDNTNQIGEYAEKINEQSPSKPVRLGAKSDWIAIK